MFIPLAQRYNEDNITTGVSNAEDAVDFETNNVSYYQYGWEQAHANNLVLSLAQQHFNEYASGIKRGIYSLQLNGSRISLLSCHHFALAKLVQTFFQEHSTEQPLDSVVVKSAFYGKKLKPPYHEFVLFELGNTHDLGLRNHVVLDRNRLHGASVLSSVQQSEFAVARDEFRFACDGNREKLLRRCDLTPYEAIETVEFPVDDLLPLYELAIVALATSLQRDDYHLFNANCYWFASLIWEQVLEMYPEAKHEVLREGVRGKFGRLYSYTSDELEREEIEIKMQAMLSHMEAIITEVQTVWPISNGGDSYKMNTQGRHDGVDPGPSPAPNAPNAGQSPQTKETMFTTSNIPYPKAPKPRIPNPNLPNPMRPHRTSSALTNSRILESESSHRRYSGAYGERRKQILSAGLDSISSSLLNDRLFLLS
ncbi:hypothetical protein RSOL_010680, partial [Rhizoctonia solani AG-3 Rhs1AP]